MATIHSDDHHSTTGGDSGPPWSLTLLLNLAPPGSVGFAPPLTRGSGLPAPVQDPDPLERQGAHGRRMRAAPGTLLPVVGAGPEGFIDGLPRPFDERLAQELRALPAPVHPALLAAALGHRGNAGVLLQCIRPVEAFALLAKGREQAWRQLGTGARQALEQGVVG